MMKGRAFHRVEPLVCSQMPTLQLTAKELIHQVRTELDAEIRNDPNTSPHSINARIDVF